ncbi:uncharacterized protein LOC135399654 isoform X2 [Ornithodoros turicata]|uniref:uncharacterized protein LOC135399654 isoform X2 n=1 Tax=Ornithodoros turicata TaxID=34597 RepID=UPI003138FBB9
MVLEHGSQSSDSSDDTDSASRGNKKQKNNAQKKRGKKAGLNTRINILADSGGTKYDFHNGQLRKTGGNTALEQQPDIGLDASRNVRQQEPVVSLGGYPYALVPATNYPGGTRPPVSMSSPPQDNEEEQDVLLVPVTSEIADMLAHTHQNNIDQLVCEILERQIEEHERRLQGARVPPQQTTNQRSPASISVNITRPALSPEMGQSTPQQSIQAAQTGTPLRVQIGEQGQQQTFQQTLQPQHQQQQITFSVGPVRNAMTYPKINAPVTIQPQPPTFQVAGQRAAQQVVQQPLLQPIGPSMLQQPGPFQQFLAQPYFQPLGQMIPQPMTEPFIQSVAQQTPQYIYEPINPHMVQPAQQFMNPAVAQRHIGGLMFQPMGQVGQPVHGPVLRTEVDAVGLCVGHIVTSVSRERMPGLAACQTTQGARQQPNINMTHGPLLIGAGIQEQLFHGYLVEPKKNKKKSKKEKSKAKRKQSVSPMTERYLQEESVRIELFNGSPPSKCRAPSVSEAGERPEPQAPGADFQYRRNNLIKSPRGNSETKLAGCTCRPFNFGSRSPSADPSTTPPATRPKQYIRDIKLTARRATASWTEESGDFGGQENQIKGRRLSQSLGQQGNALTRNLRLMKVPAQQEDQPITDSQMSEAPVQLNDKDMLCQGCKRASIQVSGKYFDGHDRSVVIARTTDQDHPTNQLGGNQVKDIDDEKQAQPLGLYGGVFAKQDEQDDSALTEQNKEDGVENIDADVVPCQDGAAAAQYLVTSYQQPPYPGAVPVLPPFPPVPLRPTASPPQMQPGPPGQAVQGTAALPSNMKENAAKDKEEQGNLFIYPAWVLVGAAIVILILIAVIYIVVYGGKSHGKRRDALEMLPTKLVRAGTTTRVGGHFWRHRHLKPMSRRREESPLDELWNL